MIKSFKIFCLFIVSMVMGVVVTSCNNADSQMMEVQENDELQVSNLRSANGIKMPVYIETNDVNPLNAGEYTLDGNQFFDIVILFASNIRGTCSTVQLHHNPNQTHILNNRATLIVPLQNKGIKVLLGVLGDHTGVGFANLTPALLEDFAQQIATCVDTYGLDGVDFDDEYAKYGDLSCTPSPSGSTYAALVARVRQLLPANKLVTAYCIGYAGGIAPASINYAWYPYYGGYGTSCISSLANAKWAAYAVDMKSPQANSTLRANAKKSKDEGMGAILCYDLRANNQNSASNTLTWIARGAHNNNAKTVVWSGVNHPKNY